MLVQWPLFSSLLGTLLPPNQSSPFRPTHAVITACISSLTSLKIKGPTSSFSSLNSLAWSFFKRWPYKVNGETIHHLCDTRLNPEASVIPLYLDSVLPVFDDGFGSLMSLFSVADWASGALRSQRCRLQSSPLLPADHCSLVQATLVAFISSHRVLLLPVLVSDRLQKSLQELIEASLFFAREKSPPCSPSSLDRDKFVC